MTSLPVEVDVEGPSAPPRRNGELVFEAPWQGRAFGLCLAVLERDGKQWSDFRMHLVRAIASRPGAPYYNAFAIALEDFLAELGYLSGPGKDRTHKQ